MKNSQKKLSLNKMTITNLNNTEMSQKVGGSGNAFCTKISFEIGCQSFTKGKVIKK